MDRRGISNGTVLIIILFAMTIWIANIVYEANQNRGSLRANSTTPTANPSLPISSTPTVPAATPPSETATPVPTATIELTPTPVPTPTATPTSAPVPQISEIVAPNGATVRLRAVTPFGYGTNGTSMPYASFEIVLSSTETQIATLSTGENWPFNGAVLHVDKLFAGVNGMNTADITITYNSASEQHHLSVR